jgi:hypothetical protein
MQSDSHTVIVIILHVYKYMKLVSNKFAFIQYSIN